MGQRSDLQVIFEQLIGPNGKVYFQAPLSLSMVYPCIVYEHSGINTDFANNKLYAYTELYKVTLIELNPDSNIRIKILSLPKCSYETHYIVDNLTHDVFSLFF